MYANHCETCTCEPEVIRPEGCICEAGEWDLVKIGLRLPPVCGSHKGDPKQNCEECEHDSECHAMTESPVLSVEA